MIGKLFTYLQSVKLFWHSRIISLVNPAQLHSRQTRAARAGFPCCCALALRWLALCALIRTSELVVLRRVCTKQSIPRRCGVIITNKNTIREPKTVSRLIMNFKSRQVRDPPVLSMPCYEPLKRKRTTAAMRCTKPLTKNKKGCSQPPYADYNGNKGKKSIHSDNLGLAGQQHFHKLNHCDAALRIIYYANPKKNRLKQ